MDRLLSVILPRPTGEPRPLRRLLRLAALRRSRLRLAELDDHLLRDIGLTRGEASLEAERVSWDAPAHWFRQGHAIGPKTPGSAQTS